MSHAEQPHPSSGPRRYHARAQTGFATGQTAPLAGSRHVWFDRVDIADTAHSFAIGDLDPETRSRLSDLRPALCGLTLDQPRIMGILNVTPDSFSDGGDLSNVQDALDRARIMADEADILDIGGESTRPGADPVTLAEETRRTVPVIRAIRDAGITTPISIDTRNAAVAEAALDAGADMVNDVTALRHDAEMAALVAARRVAVCLMHSRGTPKTMQNDPHYDDVLAEVFDYLQDRMETAVAAGISRDLLIVDPGIGFAKTLDHNISLLRGLSLLHDLGAPVLLGASRKKFIGTLGKAEAAKDRVAGSLAVALQGVMQGAQILRVHDTYQTRQALRLHLAINEEHKNG